MYNQRLGGMEFTSLFHLRLRFSFKCKLGFASNFTQQNWLFLSLRCSPAQESMWIQADMSCNQTSPPCARKISNTAENPDIVYFLNDGYRSHAAHRRNVIVPRWSLNVLASKWLLTSTLPFMSPYSPNWQGLAWKEQRQVEREERRLRQQWAFVRSGCLLTGNQNSWWSQID